MKKLLTTIMLTVIMFTAHAQLRTPSASTNYVDNQDRILGARIDIEITRLTAQLAIAQGQVASLLTSMQTVQAQNAATQQQLTALGIRIDTSFRRVVLTGNLYLKRGATVDTIDSPIR